MKAILRFLDNDDSVWTGISYVIVMLLCMIIQSVCTNLFVNQIAIPGKLVDICH